MLREEIALLMRRCVASPGSSHYPYRNDNVSGSAVRDRDPTIRDYFQKKNVVECSPAKAGQQVALVELLLDFGAAIEGRGTRKWGGLLFSAYMRRRRLRTRTICSPPGK